MAGLIPNIYVAVQLYGDSFLTYITPDVLSVSGLRISTGIKGSGPKDRVASIGTASFTLNNSASNSASTIGLYSPNHASVMTGWQLGILCQIILQDPDGFAPYTRFSGHIDVIDPAPGVHGARRVNVVVTDWMDLASRYVLTPDIGPQVNKAWDEIMLAIILGVDATPSYFSLDAGSEAYPFALDQVDTRGLEELGRLASSEFGFIYVRGDGLLRAEGRHVRMTAASVWTLTDTDYQGLDVPSSRDDIINTVRVTTHPKIVDAAPTHILYTQAETITIPASETKFLLGPYRDDETGDTCGGTAVQPVIATSDYLGNSAVDGTGSDVTGDLSIAVTSGSAGVRFDITNTSGAIVYLTLLQLRGKRVLDHGTAQYKAVDTASVTAYGEHSVTFDMVYQSSPDVGQAAADYILAKFKDATAQARQIRVIGRTSALLTQILTREISDRITLSETVTGVAGDFFINGIELVVRPDHHVEAVYTLTPAADPFSGGYWVLGTSTLGSDTLLVPF